MKLKNLSKNYFKVKIRCRTPLNLILRKTLSYLSRRKIAGIFVYVFKKLFSVTDSLFI